MRTLTSAQRAMLAKIAAGETYGNDRNHTRQILVKLGLIEFDLSRVSQGHYSHVRLTNFGRAILLPAPASSGADDLSAFDAIISTPARMESAPELADRYRRALATLSADSLYRIVPASVYMKLCEDIGVDPATWQGLSDNHNA